MNASCTLNNRSLRAFVLVALLCGTLIPSYLIWAHAGTFIANPSFEADHFPTWPGYSRQPGNGPITGWNRSGEDIGLNPVFDFGPGGSPFADNGVIPDRSQVAFIQGVGLLSQTISGLDPCKQYWLQVFVNARSYLGGTPAFSVHFNGATLFSQAVVTPVGGANPYYFLNIPFTPGVSSGVLELRSDPVAGEPDRSLLLDAVSVVQRHLDETIIRNPSFEASGVVDSPGYIAPLPIAGWTATGGYGVNISGAGPFADNGTNPDQDFVAFLQNPGASLSQTISGLTVGRSYTLSYAYNARASFGGIPHLLVTLNSLTAQDSDVTPVGGSAPYRV